MPTAREVVCRAAGSHGALSANGLAPGRRLAGVCGAVWTRSEVGPVRATAVAQIGTTRAVNSAEAVGGSGGSGCGRR